MSAWTENQLAQNAAIRRALGLPDDVEVVREANGWRVELPEESGRLAIELDAKLGGVDAARAASAHPTSTTLRLSVDGERAAASLRREQRPDVVAEADGRRVIDEREGGATDRERYVNERAKALAKAFLGAVDAHAERERLPSLWEVTAAVAAFRDLIDRGVLK